jgi:hypothetical protein
MPAKRRYNVLVNPEKVRQRNSDGRYDIFDQIELVDRISENNNADVEWITRGASRNVYAPTDERPGELEGAVIKVSRFGTEDPDSIPNNDGETGFFEDTVSSIFEEVGLDDMIVPAVPAGPGSVIQERISKFELLDPVGLWDYADDLSGDDYDDYLEAEKLIVAQEQAFQIDTSEAMREWKREMERRMVAAGFPEEVAEAWVKSQDVHVGNFAKSQNYVKVGKPRLVLVDGEDKFIIDEIEVPKLRILDYDTGRNSTPFPEGLQKIRAYSRDSKEMPGNPFKRKITKEAYDRGVELGYLEKHQGRPEYLANRIKWLKKQYDFGFPDYNNQRAQYAHDYDVKWAGKRDKAGFPVSDRRVRTIDGKTYIARRDTQHTRKDRAQEEAQKLRDLFGFQVRTLPIKNKWYWFGDPKEGGYKQVLPGPWVNHPPSATTWVNFIHAPQGFTPYARSNYTNPRLRKRAVRQAKQSNIGSPPGVWNARKAQHAKYLYEKWGGGYLGEKSEAQTGLTDWTKAKWRTRDGKDARRTDSRGKTVVARYLPDEAWKSLTPSEARATDRKKRKSKKRVVPNTRKAKNAGRKARQAVKM